MLRRRTQLGCLTHIVARLLKGLAFPQDQESTLREFMLLSKARPVRSEYWLRHPEVHVSVVDVTTWKVTVTIPFENNQPSAMAVIPLPTCCDLFPLSRTPSV
jgi:hypothetical protein